MFVGTGWRKPCGSSVVPLPINAQLISLRFSGLKEHSHGSTHEWIIWQHLLGTVEMHVPGHQLEPPTVGEVMTGTTLTQDLLVFSLTRVLSIMITVCSLERLAGGVGISLLLFSF